MNVFVKKHTAAQNDDVNSYNILLTKQNLIWEKNSLKEPHFLFALVPSPVFRNILERC